MSDTTLDAEEDSGSWKGSRRSEQIPRFRRKMKGDLHRGARGRASKWGPNQSCRSMPSEEIHALKRKYKMLTERLGVTKPNHKESSKQRGRLTYGEKGENIRGATSSAVCVGPRTAGGQVAEKGRASQGGPHACRPGILGFSPRAMEGRGKEFSRKMEWKIHLLGRLLWSLM